MAKLTEKTFAGSEGFNIFMRTWQPESEPRAIVTIVHGFNSHSGQYLWVGNQLANHGFAVYALDLRGRGKSDGERFYVDKIEDFVDDVVTLVRMAKTEHPGLPAFVLGHSAGGVVSCVYTLDHQSEIDGLICESFAYELPVPDVVLSFLKGLSHITHHTHVFALNNADFSRDAIVVEDMNHDPLIKDESQPAQTAAVMINASKRLSEGFPTIKLPVLIMHGTEDKATKPSGSQHFYEQTGSTDKTLKLYEGHYHDLLNDVGKETVLADIEQWIDARIPATKSETAAG